MSTFVKDIGNKTVTLAKNIGNKFKTATANIGDKFKTFGKTTQFGFTLIESNESCKLDDAETSLVVEGEKLKKIIIGSYVFDLSHKYLNDGNGDYPTLEQVKKDTVLDTIKNLVSAKIILSKLAEEAAKLAAKAAETAVAAIDINRIESQAEAAAKLAAEAAKLAAEKATTAAEKATTAAEKAKAAAEAAEAAKLAAEAAKLAAEAAVATSLTPGGKKSRKSKSKKGGKRRKTARARK